MVHHCRACGALNVHDAAPTWAVPCLECGAETTHQPHDPAPTPAARKAAAEARAAAVIAADPALASAPRVVLAEAVGVLDIAAPAAQPKPPRTPRQPRARRGQ